MEFSPDHGARDSLLGLNPSWQYVNTGANTGSFNMQFDEELARQLHEGQGKPTLRFFQWKPPAISLGYHQKCDDLNERKCREDGIDVVRRPTGGRGILHAEDLTYSIVMYAPHGTISRTYNAISRALVKGLALYGVEATLARSQSSSSRQHAHAALIPCFTSCARHEIEWRGRKLVGSAQRRYSNGEIDIVLQHGSILCGPAHRKLGDYLLCRDSHLTKQLAQELEEKTIDLKEIRGSEVDPDELAACLKRGFEAEWGIRFSLSSL